MASNYRVTSNSNTDKERITYTDFQQAACVNMGKIPTRVHRCVLYNNFHLIAIAYQQGVQQHILYITTLRVHVHTSDE